MITSTTAHRFRWACLFLLTVHASAFAAIEPWADERLPVRDGLVVWLDAARQPQAAGVVKRKSPLNGVPIDAWLDGSGNRFDFSQLNLADRPLYIRPDTKDDSPAAIEFNGKSQCLFATPSRTPAENVTVILVAAPLRAFGDFTAMFATAANGGNDFITGINVDLGPANSSRFDMLNVESTGAGGVANLLGGKNFDLGTFHTLCLTAGKEIALRVDGQPAGRRDRAAGATISLDRIVVGARIYSNEVADPYIRGFFDGQIAEVLVYDRALDAEQMASVEKYIGEKHAPLFAGPALKPVLPPGARALVPVKDPPAVQMFVPGFTATKLPLELTNINNLRYRADGKLVALAYDGNVYLLTDTNSDGLEDHAELFWDNKGRVQAPIGMALTPPNYAQGNGLFVAGKGKVSLIVDTDNDDKADKEIVVATGWPASIHGVDALGVALEPDGSVLFGLGTANFANGFLVGPDGKSAYDLKSERGTIMRVSPDFKKREIVATGIRFPVAIMHNPAGDLFCTDQEGATWLPNGNPFDELLNVQPGRHYGFPPRHPKHLPNVIDEPSVFDYAPQHQSTCGLAFNVSVNGGPVFGPPSWAGNAFVTGYSRGKIWRTQLVKTPLGYVAQNHLIASMTMMPADVCVSPKGDLVIAAQGGQPDWGTGPAGNGSLFKIAYTDREKPKPQPLYAYAAGPREVRVAFDAPLDPASLKGVGQSASIEFGEAVAAGDRYEMLRPGYEVVKRQTLAYRFGVDVLGVAMSTDRRTLMLQTSPMSQAAGYALTIPETQDTLDLAFGLTGVEASWTPGDGKGNPEWSDWFPTLDLDVSQALTGDSPDAQTLIGTAIKPGVLRLRTQLDLTSMLRPAIQPGATLDYEPTPETVTLELTSKARVEVKTSGDAKIEFSDKGATLTTTAPSKWLPIEIAITTTENGKVPTLAVAYHTNEDPRPRAMPLRRFILPWALPKSVTAMPATEPQPIPELAGGNWERGRAVFLSEKAMCAKCHMFNGVGSGKIGPDLSNLPHRDYASVLKDVLLPSAAINPDHIAYAITLKNDEAFMGVPRSVDDATYILGEPGGTEKRITRADIKTMEPMSISIMPVGIDQTIGKPALRDLMTFLLTPPMEPAKIEIPGAPPARTQAEVDAVLNAPHTAGGAPAPRKPLHILLAAGLKDHGIGEHDYPLWQKRWKDLLGRADGVEVDTAMDWPKPEQFEKSDVIAFFSNNPGWGPDKAPELDAYLKRGGGLVYLHYAVDGHTSPEILGARIGLAWRGGDSKFRHGALDLTFPDRTHPITRGFERASFVDESYWQLIGDPSKINALATGPEENTPRPLMWTFQPPDTKGRVYVNILGHYNWTFDDPLFRILILRGISWCAGEEDVDRLSHLATLGARLELSEGH